LPMEGPRLEELVLSPRLMRLFEKDLRRLVKGRGFRVLIVGPSGTGKTETITRVARKAGLMTGRKVAFIELSLSTMGSSYYAETEKNLGRAVRIACRLAAEGCLVVMVLNECDALLGNSEGRFEGSVDRRVRLEFQNLFSKTLPGVAVYLTMNARPDSYLPAAISRRFFKRTYLRTPRGQMAQVIATYATPAAMKQLGMTSSEFGRRVSDYLYAEGFVVARVWMHSGTQLAVRARDLQDCAPGKLQELVELFCEEVEENDAASLEEFWPMLETEFRGTPLSENNLYELTFLVRPANDRPKKVEPAVRESPSEAVYFARCT